MKKIILYLLFILPGCNSIIHKTNTPSFITLGSSDSSESWVYLCGLMYDFSVKHMNELKTLDAIGKECNIKIVAIIPHHRCVQYNYSLCWPHDNKDELLQTYQEITKALNTEKVSGYIGFSNGGFFLIQLAQHIVLKKPIIVIGAAGRINNMTGPHNTIKLLIGKKDQWHYQYALDLYNQSKNSHLIIDLIEYDGGHEIPQMLKDVLIAQ